MMMMMMIMRRRRRRITQRHDGHPVNPPSLQVVMCTKQKNQKNKIKWELKKYFVVLLGLPDVLLNGSWVGRAIVGQQTKIRHLIIGMFFFLSCCLFYVYFNSTYHLDIFLYLYVLTETVLFTLFLQQVSESFFKQDVWNIRLCDSLYEKKKIPVWKRISLCVSTTYLANVMQFVSFRYKPLFLLFVQND